jgi:two-component system, NarL family, sensor kinase
MKGKVILSNEDVEQLENALHMLDTSIIELRKVAENMIPEKLALQGLKEYLTDFCYTVEKERNINIKLSFSDGFALSNTSNDISIFRIIKAIVDYTLKYAESTEISITLTQENSILSLQVITNGNGFDLTIPYSKGAKEIAYVKLSIEMIKGDFQILPNRQKGNEIFIELNLKNLP